MTPANSAARRVHVVHGARADVHAHEVAQELRRLRVALHVGLRRRALVDPGLDAVAVDGRNVRPAEGLKQVDLRRRGRGSPKGHTPKS